jgi:hypothetical protein
MKMFIGSIQKEKDYNDQISKIEGKKKRNSDMKYYFGFYFDF